MIDLARVLTRRSGRRAALRRWEDRQGSAGLASDARPVDLTLMLVWLGLLGGLLELAAVLAQRELSDRISVDSLRTNRHFVWMIPVASVILSTTCGLFLSRLARLRPAAARWLACRFGAGLLAIGPLLAIEGLYPIAALVLACGLASRLGPWLEARGGQIQRLVRASLPPLMVGLVVLIAAVAAWVKTSERRALAALPTTRQGSPNVLLIVLDNVRAGSMSLHGHDRPTTPRLEAIAAEGVRFDAARSAAPWTLPSHASIFTGQWPHRLSVDWDRGLDATFPTLAGHLYGQGYATAGFVANTYYCHSRYGLDRGFARYEDFLENETISPFEVLRSSSLGKRLLALFGYSLNFSPAEKGSRKSAATISENALAWLSGRPRGRPFFLFLNYYDAHAPFQPPEASDPRFGLAAKPQQLQAEIMRRSRHLAAGKLRPGDGDREQIHRDTVTLLKDGYESCIAALDAQIGRLFDGLRSRGLLEDTLVIVTSDHGEHFAEHGFCGHGMSLYDRELHVPLIIVPPDGFPTVRKVVSEPVSLRDLPATILDMLGQADRSPFPGRSLARLFRNGSPVSEPEPEPVLSEVGHQTKDAPSPQVPSTQGPLKSILADGKAYIRNGNGREELYDLEADPMETRNLAGGAAQAPPVEHWRTLLDRVLNSTPSPPR